MPRELIVDGYNVIHAWPELAPLMATRELEEARRRLVGALAGYAAATGEQVVVVFDAHRREPGEGADTVDGVTVIFGSRVQSADHVIERRVSEAARSGRAGEVTVATSDRLQRDMVMAMGASVIGAVALGNEVRAVQVDGGSDLARRSRDAHHARRFEHALDETARQALEDIRRGLAAGADPQPGTSAVSVGDDAAGPTVDAGGTARPRYVWVPLTGPAPPDTTRGSGPATDTGEDRNVRANRRRGRQ